MKLKIEGNDNNEQGAHVDVGKRGLAPGNARLPLHTCPIDGGTHAVIGSGGGNVDTDIETEGGGVDPERKTPSPST